MSSQFALLKTRRFAPFFATQFLGAFNDNLFKNALIVLLTFQVGKWSTVAPAVLANIAVGVFILPYFIFSATAGQLADKYDKAMLARLVKVLEMGIMGVAAVGFWLTSVEVLMGALFLLGLHSTLFGPVKYAILPQHLHEDELVGGNAWVEAGTFVAILIGTLAGGMMAGSLANPQWIASCGLVVAVAGYLTARQIPPAPAPDPGLRVNLNPFTETWRNIAFSREDRAVFLSILAISWFWLYGALFIAQLPAYVHNVLGGNETAVTLLLAILTVGIGTGSLLCERLSGKHVEIGLVPFGSIGLTLFGLDIALASPSTLPPGAPLSLLQFIAAPGMWRIFVDLLIFGMFGGFFIVPLYTLVQVRSAPEHRARIIAANNIMNALFTVVGVLAAAGMLAAGLSIAQLFAVYAVCNAAVALYIYGVVPEFLQRFVVWLLVHTIYRFERIGIEEHIPDEGAAVLVCNHVTPVDALLIMAASRRPVRFVVEPELLKNSLLAFVLRESRAIAFDDEESVRREVAAALAAGDLVGCFPEGRPTADGELQAFDPRYQRLLAGLTAPVVPLALRGMWDSPFSAKPGSFLGKWLTRGLAPAIALVATCQVGATELRTVVAELRGDGR